jgi:hypothetical protein
VAQAGGVIGGYDSPFLKPWPAELVMLKTADLTRRIAIPHTTCWPEGVPGLLGLRQIQILQTSRQITIVYEDDHHFRNIYMNVPHTPKPLPEWLGESVGHWEADTLVVDTLGFVRHAAASVDRYGTPVTEGLHVVERYRIVRDAPAEPVIPAINQRNAALDTLDRDGPTLQVLITVEDPNVFKRAWSTVVNYQRNRLPQLREQVCAENNRAFFQLMPIATVPDF